MGSEVHGCMNKYIYLTEQTIPKYKTVIIIYLTHWGRVTHIWVSKLTIIGSDNCLSPGRRQAIIWTNAGILLMWTLGTNFSEILSKIHTCPFKKIHLKIWKMVPILSWPQCVEDSHEISNSCTVKHNVPAYLFQGSQYPPHIHDIYTNKTCRLVHHKDTTVKC